MLAHPGRVGRVGVAFRRRGAMAWTPAQLPSLALWLDANDASTITLNGPTVSQWNDKSGNNLHATETVASKQPTYGLLSGKPALTFDGLDDRMLFTNVEMYQKAAFVLYLSSNINAPAVQMILGGNGFNNQIRQSATINYASATSAYSTPPNSPATIVSGKTNIAAMLCGDVLSLGVDGVYNTGGTYIPGNTGLLYGQIGARGAAALGVDFLNGTVGEIIFTDFPSIEDRQKIEGYLAWKWGSEANLPANHPYKTNPPTV
jgi:hypothetical protein